MLFFFDVSLMDYVFHLLAPPLIVCVFFSCFLLLFFWITHEPPLRVYLSLLGLQLSLRLQSNVSALPFALWMPLSMKVFFSLLSVLKFSMKNVRKQFFFP